MYSVFGLSHDASLLLYALISILGLILLIAKFKMNPFVALIVGAVFMGLISGMPFTDIVKSYQEGVASVLGFIAIVLGLGTMLGKLMAESGGAERIAQTLVRVFGEKNVHWAMMVVALICGIPVFIQVGIVLLFPLVFVIAKHTGTSLIKIGLSLVAGLAVVHSLIPPHPAAMLAVGIFNADVGKTIFLALIVSLPAAAIAGPLYGTWISKRIKVETSSELMEQFTETKDRELPGFGITLFTILLPVILMLLATIVDLILPETNGFRQVVDFIGSPIIALLLALLFSFYSFGYARGFSKQQILKYTNDCLGPVASIILLIGAGGGFNRILTDSGVGDAIAGFAQSAHLSPLVLAFVIAGLIRAAVGSATVAMTTAAGIVAPIAMTMPGVSPELLVLATGAGSIILSHVNDSGFWIVKEYLNLSVPQTLKTWTVMETILGFAAFGMVLLLSVFI
ncbi:GntP family permease [Paenibacillus sp. FSL H7-0942]|uniref:GntP family permease n=1 Tax=Paenibacillus TaxID=44249 RepID=UPI0003E24DB7|nr:MULTISPECIES: GntP family permease [Paenibacillus]ETT36839.1 Gluconate transporter, permease protein [Paenibacillus sp. FSL R5-192]ETT51159.1 Gluconate transporter, permease protein [Paenibacillus sp. FSL H7-689]OMF09732.1 permease DsdX [Paenibacillus amylolyticus]